MSWPPFSTADCVLMSKRIDLIQYPLHEMLPNARRYLNQEETERADRFHFAKHQRRFTLARAGLRSLLATYLQENPQALEFRYGLNGKPEVINQHGLQFNLSHSEDLALLAIGQSYPLGVDLEFFSARPYLGIASHVFSQQEQDILAALPPALQPLAFFNGWAQKEALMKACGLGLQYPTKSIDLALLPQSPQTIYDSITNADWIIQTCSPRMACAGGLCHHPCIMEIRYFSIATLSDFFAS